MGSRLGRIWEYRKEARERSTAQLAVAQRSPETRPLPVVANQAARVVRRVSVLDAAQGHGKDRTAGSRNAVASNNGGPSLKWSI